MTTYFKIFGNKIPFVINGVSTHHVLLDLFIPNYEVKNTFKDRVNFLIALEHVITPHFKFIVLVNV